MRHFDNAPFGVFASDNATCRQRTVWCHGSLATMRHVENAPFGVFAIATMRHVDNTPFYICSLATMRRPKVTEISHMHNSRQTFNEAASHDPEAGICFCTGGFGFWKKMQFDMYCVD